MREGSFIKSKQKLIERANQFLQLTHNADEIASYTILLRELNDATYINSKTKKGELSYFIIDSYSGDRSLGDDVVYFDNHW